jgi:hypothetical protein
MFTAGFDVIYELDRGLLEAALLQEEADFGSGPVQMWPPFMVSAPVDGDTVSFVVTGLRLEAGSFAEAIVTMPFAEGVITRGDTVRARDLDGEIVIKAAIVATDPAADPADPTAPPRSSIGVDFRTANAYVAPSDEACKRINAASPELGQNNCFWFKGIVGGAMTDALRKNGVRGGSPSFAIDAHRDSYDLGTLTSKPGVKWITSQTLGIFGVLKNEPAPARIQEKLDRDIAPARDNPWDGGDPLGVLLSPRALQLVVGAPMVLEGARSRATDAYKAAHPEVFAGHDDAWAAAWFATWLATPEGQKAVDDLTVAPLGSGHWVEKVDVPSPFTATSDVHTIEVVPEDGRLVVHAHAHVDLEAAGDADVDVPVAITLSVDDNELSSHAQVLEPDVDDHLALWAKVVFGVIGKLVSASIGVGVLVAWLGGELAESITNGIAGAKIEDQAAARLKPQKAQQLPFRAHDVIIKPDGMLIRGEKPRSLEMEHHLRPHLELVITELSATPSRTSPASTDRYDWPGDPELGVEPRSFRFAHTWTDHVFEVRAQPVDSVAPLSVHSWRAQLGRIHDLVAGDGWVVVDPRPSCDDGPVIELGQTQPQVNSYWARTPLPPPDGTEVPRAIEVVVEPGAGPPQTVWHIQTRAADSNYFIHFHVAGEDAAGHQLEAEGWLRVRGEEAIFGDDYRAALDELKKKQGSDLARTMRKYKDRLVPAPVPPGPGPDPLLAGRGPDPLVNPVEGFIQQRDPEIVDKQLRNVIGEIRDDGGYV